MLEACELQATHHVPLSRWSLEELTRQVCQSGLVAQLSNSTLWRWLHEDAIRPWQHRCWIFPRAPDFEAKAGRILDLYQRQWEGKALPEDEFVVSTDEKTSIQARHRVHPTVPPQPKIPMKVEHEYERKGAWAYLAALDVHRPKLFGRCEAKSGLEHELLFQPNPPLERLKLAKDFAKAKRHHPSKGFPKEIARVLYFASIVVALLRRQRRITRLSNQDILTGVEWAITQAWLDQRTLGLFREAKEYLLAVGETKDPTP